jgi:COMPASS component SWD2
LTDDVVKNMVIGRVFKDNTNKINSLDFHKDGELLVTASDDESLHVYNSSSGRLDRTVLSKKYGVDLIRFTHHPNSVICASKNGWDDSIRYLSLHDNRYLRYFKGHRDKVVSLAMSPLEDFFISGSLDDTIRLWDLRTTACQGLLRRKGRSSVAFDPQGLVFAAGIDNNTVKLFDIRMFDKGPFLTFVVDHTHNLQWHTLKFSNDGKHILLSTNENLIFLIDAFNGEQKQTYSSFVNEHASLLEASFSPDGQYVLSGSELGTIHIWQALSGKEVAVLNGHHSSVGVVQWNPKTLMIASGCTNLAFWIPSDSDLQMTDAQP